MNRPADLLSKLLVGRIHHQPFVCVFDIHYPLERIEMHRTSVFVGNEVDYLRLVCSCEASRKADYATRIALMDLPAGGTDRSWFVDFSDFLAGLIL